MSVPPAILDLRIVSSDAHRVRLWLPLFLLWPLLLALGVLALVLTLLADVALLLLGQRYHHYTLLLYRLFEATTELRGLVVRVKRPDANVDIVLM